MGALELLNRLTPYRGFESHPSATPLLYAVVNAPSTGETTAQNGLFVHNVTAVGSAPNSFTRQVNGRERAVSSAPKRLIRPALFLDIKVPKRLAIGGKFVL